MKVGKCFEKGVFEFKKAADFILKFLKSKNNVLRYCIYISNNGFDYITEIYIMLVTFIELDIIILTRLHFSTPL